MVKANDSWYKQVDQMYGLVQCDGCEGCGYVTDNAQRIPWIWHTRELRDSNDKPLDPKATKVKCGKCEGNGRIPRHRLTQTKKKSYRDHGIGG